MSKQSSFYILRPVAIELPLCPYVSQMYGQTFPTLSKDANMSTAHSDFERHHLFSFLRRSLDFIIVIYANEVYVQGCQNPF